MTDFARAVQSMLEKLTEDEKDAFNALVSMARERGQGAERPRAYRVTLLGQLFAHGDRAPNVTRAVDVMAYSRDEAMAQARMSAQHPTGEWWGVPVVVGCDPVPPDTGTERTD